MKLRIIPFLLLISFQIQAQNPLSKGFTMLETGHFADAAVFFKNYLKTDPNNKTAQLCYGRGVGLAGNPKEAIAVFEKLQKKYPKDYEIDLNYAEAFMWSKNYTKALDLYKDLTQRDSTNFAALLGYANAFSENKKYDEALSYVERALKVSPGNANAEVSQKYMRLGKASTLANVGKFKEAIVFLDKILDKNPQDVDALINKAQMLQSSKDYTNAIIIYTKLTQIKSKKVDGYLGLANIANAQKKNKEALNFALKAVEIADSSTNLKAQLAKVNALGWNKKFTDAFALLGHLNAQYPGNLEVLSGYGRLSIWSKSFAKASKIYAQLLAKSPSSFDGNLGFADANHAQGMDNKSFRYVRNTLNYYNNQRDALQFLERLQVAHDPTFSTHDYMSKDNGGNISTNYRGTLTYDPTALIRTNVFYYHREAENTKLDNGIGKLDINQLGGGAEFRVNGFFKIGANASLLKTKTHDNFLKEINSELKLGRFQILELRYYEELQSFTAELISRNLKMGNYTANYNLSLPSKFGIYSQMIHTVISDKNTRDLLFASFYYDITQSPVLKAGTNVSLFTFKNQVPSVYFSPNIFKGYELFAATENTNEVNAKWIYQATVAGGIQKISNEKFQGTYRFDVKTGWKFSPRFNFLVYFMRSNSAASSVQGFTYNEWGLKAKYIFPARWL